MDKTQVTYCELKLLDSIRAISKNGYNCEVRLLNDGSYAVYEIRKKKLTIGKSKMAG